MHNTLAQINALRDTIIAWAAEEDSVRVMIAVGSFARRDYPADEWADLDLELYVTDVEALTRDDSWLAQFGEVWVKLPFPRGDGVPEWLILYDDALKVDFSFHPLDDLRALTADPLHDVFNRGYTVLIDKDGRASQFRPPTYRANPVAPPTAEAFEQVIQHFWYGVVYVAKQIKRGRLWVAWYRDTTIKGELLHMIEWHARALHGPEHDTWHDGRFMQEWAGPGVWEALAACFPRLDAADQAAALRATMALFRRLAQETADRWGYAYPVQLDARVTAFVEHITGGDDV